MSKTLKIGILLLLALPVSLLAHSRYPQVVFRYNNVDYSLPEDNKVLKIAYGRDAYRSLPIRIHKLLTEDPVSISHFERLTKKAQRSLKIVVEYQSPTGAQTNKMDEIVLPHELPLEYEHLNSEKGLISHLVTEVAKRTDNAQTQLSKASQNKSNETLDKDTAFHEGWVLYNKSLVDSALRKKVGNTSAKLVKPAFDGSLETVKKPTLEHYLSTKGCVSALLCGLDKNGANRQAVQEAFEQTSIPKRTVDTFLIAYALDNPNDARRAAKIFDLSTGFSAKPEDIALRFGSSSIAYAFDERTSFKSRCEDCTALGMSNEKIICGLNSTAPISSPTQIATQPTEEPKALLEDTELLGILTK